MTPHSRSFLWQIPLTMLACVAGTLLAVWAISELAGFAMHTSRIAAISAVLAGAAIARHERARARGENCSTASNS
ncbi:MAG: hypothetical protein FJ363_05255 [Gemmatimonadetes bacterium]|nr:hypothetical protein [Gemmatimonadota bacterium]